MNSSTKIIPIDIITTDIEKALAHIEPMLLYYTYVLLMANS